MPARAPFWDAAIRMAQEGTRPRDIARALDQEPETIWNLLTCARRQGYAVPRFVTARAPAPAPRCKIGVSLDERSLAKLRLEAAARRVAPSTLAGQLLEIVAGGGMIGAVLEEGRADG